MERVKSKAKRSRGYTLLEYAAGAAILAGILYAALNLMGDGMKDLAGSIGSWATERGQELSGVGGGN